MAMKLVTGISQLRFGPLYAQRSQQLRTGITGELFQVTTQGRGAFMICNISDGETRGNHAKPRVKSRELAQKRLNRRLEDPSLLRTRRTLDGLQPVEDQ